MRDLFTLSRGKKNEESLTVYFYRKENERFLSFPLGSVLNKIAHFLPVRIYGQGIFNFPFPLGSVLKKSLIFLPVKIYGLNCWQEISGHKNSRT